MVIPVTHFPTDESGAKVTEYGLQATLSALGAVATNFEATVNTVSNAVN